MMIRKEVRRATKMVSREDQKIILSTIKGNQIKDGDLRERNHE